MIETITAGIDLAVFWIIWLQAHGFLFLLPVHVPQPALFISTSHKVP